MNVLIFSESPADEAAIRVLIDALLDTKTHAEWFPRLRDRRGFAWVLKLLPAVLKYSYYGTDADGLVVVLDSNGSPVSEQHVSGKRDSRLYRLRCAAEKTWATIRPRPERTPLKTAIGLAAPAVEAWYRCGIDPHASEARWIRDMQAGASAPRRIRELKRAVYGTARPSLPQETESAVREARRLATDLALLENSFPIGFGALARDVRAWSPSS